MTMKCEHDYNDELLAFNPVSLILDTFTAMEEDNNQQFCLSQPLFTSNNNISINNSNPKIHCQPDMTMNNQESTSYPTNSSPSQCNYQKQCHDEALAPLSPDEDKTAFVPISVTPTSLMSLSNIEDCICTDYPTTFLLTSPDGGRKFDSNILDSLAIIPPPITAEVSPLTTKSFRNDGNDDDSNSISSSVVLASMAMEIVGSFVNDIVISNNTSDESIQEWGNIDNSYPDSEFHQNDIPKLIILYKDFSTVGTRARNNRMNEYTMAINETCNRTRDTWHLKPDLDESSDASNDIEDTEKYEVVSI